MADANSELITLLQREADAEREQVLAQGRSQAESILAEARRQAEEVVTAARTRLEADHKTALVKAQSTAQLHAASLVLRAKEEEIGRIFDRADAELNRLLSDGQRYPAALRTFVEEALQGFQDRAIVSVNPSDEAVVQGLARVRGWNVDVHGDSAVRGGARVSAPDGRFIVTNTVASRLGRARPALAAELAKTLWD